MNSIAVISDDEANDFFVKKKRLSCAGQYLYEQMFAYAFFIVNVNKFLVRVKLTLFDSQIQVLKYSNNHYCNATVCVVFHHRAQWTT